MNEDTMVIVTLRTNAINLLKVIYELKSGKPAKGDSFALFAMQIANYNKVPLHTLLSTNPGDFFHVPIK